MKPNVVRALVVCALLLGGPAGGVSTADEFADRQAKRQVEFPEKIRPLLARYCYECHGEQDAQAELNLQAVDTPLKVLQDRKRWLEVVAKLTTEEMPPAEHDPKPTMDERKLLVDWLTELVNDIDCRGSPDPGRVTLRRLNRREYRNTVRDLVGVDYEPSAEFPGDDTGYGFDNIGDVMTLPPILMEKYLAAAEEIANQAIDPTGGKKPVDQRIIGNKLQGDGNPEGLLSRIFLTQGEATAKVPIPMEGEYEIRVMAYGHQGGTEPVKMAVRVNDETVRQFDIPQTENEAREFVTRTTLKLGTHRVGVAFLNDFWDPNESNPERRDRNLIVGYVHVRGPLNAEVQGLPESHKRIIFVHPDTARTRRGATEQVLRRLATRAFRRPATDDEVNRLVALARSVRSEGGAYEQGIQLALQAVLCSPHFLFRSEPDLEGQGDKPRDLNDYELATRLSYFLWSSMPDDELFELAEAGKLKSPEVIEQQVRRMLADPKSHALIENFAGQWLELRSLDQRTPDREMFPAFTDELREAMRKETELFLSAIIREDRSLVDLLDADFTYVNGPLAKLYGISGVEGQEFQRVSLDGSERGGLLTQASILTITSNPTRTSPVKRGKWILENLLGTPPPPPPPDVPELDEKKDASSAKTLREKLELHLVNPGCASCHQRMDPLGFALENFDAIGAWRTSDGGQPIDSRGELPGGETFTGARELRKLLSRERKEQFVECLTEKMLIYALGRGLDYQDKCTVDQIKAAVAQDGNRFSRLVIEIAKSEPFRKQGPKRHE
jgi:hypothetical protein